MSRLYSNTDFYNAVNSNDIGEVKRLYEQSQDRTLGKIDINWDNPNDNYKSPLLAAVINKNSELVKFLLDKGAKTENFCHTLHTSPLLCLLDDNSGIKRPHIDVTTVDIVKLLLEKGANPRSFYTLPPIRKKISPLSIVIGDDWSNEGFEGQIKQLILDKVTKKNSGTPVPVVPEQSFDNDVSNINPIHEGQNNEGQNNEGQNNEGGRRRRKRKTGKKRKTCRRKKTCKRRRR
jgi:ankyrin repeat protein